MCAAGGDLRVHVDLRTYFPAQTHNDSHCTFGTLVSMILSSRDLFSQRAYNIFDTPWSMIDTRICRDANLLFSPKWFKEPWTC